MIGNQKGPGTVVGANVKLQGTLRDTADIVVHGQVDGEVISEQNVSIAETGIIKGPVTASVISLSGTIKGAAAAKEKLEIMPSGKLQGSLITKNLIIHSGAIFNGKSSMENGAEKSVKDETAKNDDQKEKDEIFDEAGAESE